mgnify:CR=1 FL=1
MIITTLIDYMGSDITVVNAARVSFGKQVERGRTYTNDKDDKLIKYLAKHKHMSPFGHCFVTFHVKAPIFVARQLVKHKFLRWNEISRRYVDNQPNLYYPYDDVWRGRSLDKKQGSSGEVDLKQTDLLDALIEGNEWQIKLYKDLVKSGVAPEQARMVLPQSTMTEWYWSGSLDAFADMCNLRCASDTQYETRLVATQISDKMLKLFPVSWNALVKVNGHQVEKMTDFTVSPKDIWKDGDGGELFI